MFCIWFSWCSIEYHDYLCKQPIPKYSNTTMNGLSIKFESSIYLSIQLINCIYPTPFCNRRNCCYTWFPTDQTNSSLSNPYTWFGSNTSKHHSIDTSDTHNSLQSEPSSKLNLSSKAILTYKYNSCPIYLYSTDKLRYRIFIGSTSVWTVSKDRFHWPPFDWKYTINSSSVSYWLVTWLFSKTDRHSNPANTTYNWIADYHFLVCMFTIEPRHFLFWVRLYFDGWWYAASCTFVWQLWFPNYVFPKCYYWRIWSLNHTFRSISFHSRLPSILFYSHYCILSITAIVIEFLNTYSNSKTHNVWKDSMFQPTNQLSGKTSISIECPKTQQTSYRL